MNNRQVPRPYQSLPAPRGSQGCPPGLARSWPAPGQHCWPHPRKGTSTQLAQRPPSLHRAHGTANPLGCRRGSGTSTAPGPPSGLSAARSSSSFGRTMLGLGEKAAGGPGRKDRRAGTYSWWTGEGVRPDGDILGLPQTGAIVRASAPNCWRLPQTRVLYLTAPRPNLPPPVSRSRRAALGAGGWGGGVGRVQVLL